MEDAAKIVEFGSARIAVSVNFWRSADQSFRT